MMVSSLAIDASGNEKVLRDLRGKRHMAGSSKKTKRSEGGYFAFQRAISARRREREPSSEVLPGNCYRRGSFYGVTRGERSFSSRYMAPSLMKKGKLKKHAGALYLSSSERNLTNSLRAARGFLQEGN